MSQFENLEDYLAAVRKLLPGNVLVEGEVDDDGVWVIKIHPGLVFMTSRYQPPLEPEALVQELGELLEQHEGMF